MFGQVLSTAIMPHHCHQPPSPMQRGYVFQRCMLGVITVGDAVHPIIGSSFFPGLVQQALMIHYTHPFFYYNAIVLIL